MSKVSKFFVFIALLEIVMQADALNFYNPKTNFTFLITGGYRDPKENLARYITSLRFRKPSKYYGENHICGGAIIAPNLILTAAHCVVHGRNVLPMKPSLFTVIAGTVYRLTETPTTISRKVQYVQAHPRYVAKAHFNDIALLILKSNITANNTTISYVKLPDEALKPGAVCTVLGWGRVINDGPLASKLLYADVTVWSKESCRLRFPWIMDGMICAGDYSDSEVDACSGDSGGPLICNGTLHGVVSFGVGCGTEGFPGVYTDIYHFRKWIEHNNARKFSMNFKLLFIWLILYFVIL